MEHRNIPISYLDQSCNTRVRRPTNQDCGSSSVLPRDCRQETANPRTGAVCEVNSTTMPDRSFRSQSYLLFPRSQVLMESVCILNKVKKSLAIGRAVSADFKIAANIHCVPKK